MLGTQHLRGKHACVAAIGRVASVGGVLALVSMWVMAASGACGRATWWHVGMRHGAVSPSHERWRNLLLPRCHACNASTHHDSRMRMLGFARIASRPSGRARQRACMQASERACMHKIRVKFSTHPRDNPPRPPLERKRYATIEKDPDTPPSRTHALDARTHPTH